MADPVLPDDIADGVLQSQVHLVHCLKHVVRMCRRHRNQALVMP